MGFRRAQKRFPRTTAAATKVSGNVEANVDPRDVSVISSDGSIPCLGGQCDLSTPSRWKSLSDGNLIGQHFSSRVAVHDMEFTMPPERRAGELGLRSVKKRVSTSFDNLFFKDFKKSRPRDAESSPEPLERVLTGRSSQGANGIKHSRPLRWFEDYARKTTSPPNIEAESNNAKASNDKDEQVQFEQVQVDGLNYLRTRGNGEPQAVSKENHLKDLSVTHNQETVINQSQEEEPEVLVKESSNTPAQVGRCGKTAAGTARCLLDVANFLEEEKIESSYDELRGLQLRVRFVSERIEKAMYQAKEREMVKLLAEKVEGEAAAKIELNTRAQAHARECLKNQILIREKLTLRAEFSEKLECARGARADLERKHAIEIAAEQEKNVCQICFTECRDAIVLPCMHFLYCNACLIKHQARKDDCPTCRTKISGVLLCKLRTS